MKQALLVPLFFPLAAFCVAAVTESRSPTRPLEKLIRLVPIALGFADFGLLWDPVGLLQLTPDSSVWLSRAMKMVSAVIACSGVFLAYSRRATGVWVACGSLMLALLWMFDVVVA